VSKGCCRSRISKVIRGHIHGLYRCDRAIFVEVILSCMIPISCQRRLITTLMAYGQQRRYFEPACVKRKILSTKKEYRVPFPVHHHHDNIQRSSIRSMPPCTGTGRFIHLSEYEVAFDSASSFSLHFLRSQPPSSMLCLKSSPYS
jgi:hypothetical protein